MAVPQTTYGTRIAEGFPGMLANDTQVDTDSLIVESANVPFGRAVSQGDAESGCLLGLPSGRFFRGVSRANPTLSHDTADQYEETDTAGILRRGDIYVSPDSDVAINDPVYADNVTGRLGSASGGGKTLIAEARWMTSGSEDGLAVVRLERAAVATP